MTRQRKQEPHAGIYIRPCDPNARQKRDLEKPMHGSPEKLPIDPSALRLDEARVVWPYAIDKHCLIKTATETCAFQDKGNAEDGWRER